MGEHISVETEDGIAVVTIDRPPVNALDPALLTEGTRVVAELEARAPAAVVLRGRPGSFSAGLDLKVAPTLDDDGRRAMVRGINRLFVAWYGLPHPVVCAVGGHAIAGGLILALCGDWRVVGRSGRFGLTELAVGAPFPVAASAIVRAELGPEVARRLMLRADLTDAEGAIAAGAFDEQVEDAEVFHRAKVVAQEMAALPAAAFAQTKRDLRGALLAELRDAIASDSDPALDAGLADDARRRAADLLG